MRREALNLVCEIEVRPGAAEDHLCRALGDPDKSLVAFAVFLLIRSINRLKKQEEEAPPPPDKKDCSYCFTSVPIKATRCPHCTSELEAA